MSIERKKDDPSVTIGMSDQLLCAALAKSCRTYPGVLSLDKEAQDKALDILTRDIASSDGVRLTRKDDMIIVDVYVVVKYGTKIPQLAWELQKKLSKEIRSITDKDVEEINIHIEGVGV